jgi:uncharacterized protein YndB with AHSA1/START domain
MTAFRHERLFQASPAALFDAARDPVRLARWWGPEGFSNTFSTFEFVPGGKWAFTMHSPDGKDYPNESVFLEIEENARIKIGHVAEPHFTLELLLHAQGTGTRLEWIQTFENEATARAMEPIVKVANEQNLDRLAVELDARGAI